MEARNVDGGEGGAVLDLLFGGASSSESDSLALSL